MKLIIFPLSILFIVTLLAQTGLGYSTKFDDFGLDQQTLDNMYYDEHNHPVVYGNGTPYDEPGLFKKYIIGENSYRWENGTYNPEGLDWSFDLHQGQGANSLLNVNIGSSALGVIALVVALIAICVVAGVRILDSGISDISIKTLVFGTGLVGIWSILSMLSFPLINTLAIFGAINCYA